VGGPGGSSEGEGIWRAGAVAVLGPRAPMPVAHASWAVAVSNGEQASCVPSASHARDGGKGHTVVPGCGQAEQATHCLPTEESWEPVCGLRSHEVEALPIARQNVEGAEADAARAEAPGGGREVLDVCAMQHVVLELGVGDAGWGLAIALRQQAPLADRRWLRACTRATALQRGAHVLAPWGHDTSPFVR
jgi:hypothetical protein